MQSRGEQLNLSFIQLATRVEAWRERLASCGNEPDPPSLARPVAVALSNRVAFVELFFALRALNRPMVAIDGVAPEERRLEICRRFGVSRLIEVQGDQIGDGDDLGEGLWLRSVALDGQIELPPGTALVKLTSGSTGEPNGACFDEAALHAGIDQIAAGMELKPSDRVLVTIPLSHSYGFDNAVLALAVVGTPLVLEPSFFPQALLRAALESEATFLPLVPPLVRSLAQAEWPENLQLRRVICAGGTLDSEAADAFHRSSGLPVHNFYGSSETGGICFECRPEEPAAAGTVGQPLPGVSVALEEGRVTVDSAANSIGQPGQPRSDKKRVVTGDLAVWSEGGRLRLTGRSAEVLNIGGRKVPVVRLEQALQGLDGVSEAAVVGVADPTRGDLSVGFVVTEHWPIDTQGLAAGVTPRRLSRIEELPHNDRGKLDRQALRRRAAKIVQQGAHPKNPDSPKDKTTHR